MLNNINYYNPYVWILSFINYIKDFFCNFLKKDRDYNELDSQNKSELIGTINSIKSKRLYIDNDVRSNISKIKLECDNLIPLSIELYEKISKITKPAERKQSYIPYKKRVHPGFDKEEAIKKYNKVDKKNNILEEKIEKIPNFNINTPKLKLNTEPITIKEFNNALKGLRNSVDSMGMAKNILDNCSIEHKTKIINCYNKLFNGQGNISNINFGDSYYVYKESKKGKYDDIKSFRSIISFPLLVRLFHRILMIRLTDYLIKNKMIDLEINKGGIRGIKYGILQQIYKVKTIMKHSNENKRSCSVLFMDIADAFGNIKLEALFDIMRKYKIDDKFINYVKMFYKDMNYQIKTFKWKTELLDWKKGIVQGCPLSALLFTLAINYIINDLNKRYNKTHGYNINGSRCLFTTYLDDICIITETPQGLKIIFEEFNELLQNIGLPINQQKCGVMYVNTDEGEHKLDIPIKKDIKYLGEILESNGNNDKAYNVAITKLRYLMIRLDKSKRVDKDVKVKVFNKTVLPYIRTKLSSLFDLDNIKKTHIVSYINYYLQKWGNNEFVNVLENATTLLTDTNDNFVNTLNKVNKIEEINKSNLELLRNKKQKLHYKYE